MEAIVKASPPIAATSLMLGGVSLAEWLVIATLLYTLLQTFFLLRDRAYRPWAEARKLKAAEAAADAQRKAL